MKKVLLLSFLLAALFQVKAQDGTRDSTFGTGGYVLLGARYDASAFQSGGRLLVVRTATDGFSLTRYKADGSVDAGFGTNGTQTVQVPVITTITSISLSMQKNNDNMVVQASGNDANGNTTTVLLRLNSSGTLDTTFGSGGYIYIMQPRGFIVAQDDGKIVIASGSNISRLNLNGTLDWSTTLPSQYNLLDLAVGDDGKIVIGARDNSNGTRLLLRFNGDGKTTSFILPVLQLTPLSVVAVQPDGKLLAATNPSSGPIGYLVRFNPDGTLDNSFGDNFAGTNGVSIVDQYIVQILLQADGKILLSGTGNDNFNLYITRFNTNGTRDATFHNPQFDGFFRSSPNFSMTIAQNRLYFVGYNTGSLHNIPFVGSMLIAFRLGGCTPPTFLNNNSIVLDASCGNSDGTISILPTSGTAPFMYSKDGGVSYIAGPNAGYTFGSLAAGTYNLRLKDANGCESAVVSKEVKAVYGCPVTCVAPTFLNSNAIVLDASCGKSDGSITIIPTSGTAPFMYSANGGTTYVTGPNSGFTFSGLAGGTYRLRIKDATGCESVVIEKTVRNIYNCPGITTLFDRASSLISKEALAISPNPTKGQFKVLLPNIISGKAELSVFDAKGVAIQKRQVVFSKSNTLDFDLTGRSPGLYYIQMVTGNGTRVAKVVIQ